MKDPTEDMLCLQDCDETESEFYRLRGPKAPWGDYGDILIHGMADSCIRNTASPKLQRSGPYVPPISFPGLDCIIVTDAVRQHLLASGLTGFSFVPVIKSVIVPIDWHEWDLLADEPPYHPEDGEPESYLQADEHSQELAARMPQLWRLITVQGATEIREPLGGSRAAGVKVTLRAYSWQGVDFFHADTTLHTYVSARAQQWLLDNYTPWIRCEAVGNR